MNEPQPPPPPPPPIAFSTRMPKGAKRPKTSRACLACRKLKARCEPSIDSGPSTDTVPSICHRCKTLCLECLYETAQRKVVAAAPLPPEPSQAQDANPTSHGKRTRAEGSFDPGNFHNPHAVALSPGLQPRPLSKPLYRQVPLAMLEEAAERWPERPPFPACVLSHLISRNPSFKTEALQYCYTQQPLDRDLQAWLQAFPSLCRGSQVFNLMSRQVEPPLISALDIEFLRERLLPFEVNLLTIFDGLYAHFAPTLSPPISGSASLASCQSHSETFMLATALLIAMPHIEGQPGLAECRTPLRRVVDTSLRQALHSPNRNIFTILALHACATCLLYPVDGLVEDDRPHILAREEDDGYLECSRDLNPRATIITALRIAHDLGYSHQAQRLKESREKYEDNSQDQKAQDELAHFTYNALMWLSLMQARSAIDVAEDRIEWNSLATFEADLPQIAIKEVIKGLLPPVDFLTNRERSRCIWLARRAQLYDIARSSRHLKRDSVPFDNHPCSQQIAHHAASINKWISTYTEEMQDATELYHRGSDARGLTLHHFYSWLTRNEAMSLGYITMMTNGTETLFDMRHNFTSRPNQAGAPRKMLATIQRSMENPLMAAGSQANALADGHSNSFFGSIPYICPALPQLYDFVIWEDASLTEIPAPSILALPIIVSGLLATPVISRINARAATIESWGHGASAFHAGQYALITNYIRSLRSLHLRVQLPGWVKLAFGTASPTADLLQGPLEKLLHQISAEEKKLEFTRLRPYDFEAKDAHVEQVKKLNRIYREAGVDELRVGDEAHTPMPESRHDAFKEAQSSMRKALGRPTPPYHTYPSSIASSAQQLSSPSSGETSNSSDAFAQPFAVEPLIPYPVLEEPTVPIELHKPMPYQQWDANWSWPQ